MHRENLLLEGRAAHASNYGTYVKEDYKVS